MNKRLRILSTVVMTYMLAALCWWAVLLNRKNIDVFRLEKQLFHEQHRNQTDSGAEIIALTQYQEIVDKYKRQDLMILLEALVFGLSVILGIYFINRAFAKELAITEKQNNFLLSITHELKSPLTSIRLILDTFIKRSLPDQQIKELSSDGLQEISRLDELFNKILLATRLGTAYPYLMVNTDVSAMLNTIINKYERIYLDVKFHRDISPAVHKDLDENAFRSMINNLLENAIKYSTATPVITTKLHEKNSKIVLSIADNGVGIPQDEKLKIFDQFYRVGSESTRTSKGTGLGLYIVKRIIEAHNGKITVRDNGIPGSIFEITL